MGCSAAECVAELWFKQCQTRPVKRPCPAWRTLMCPCTEECKGGIYQFGLLEGGDLVAPVSSLPTRSVRSRPASAKVSCIYFLLPAPPGHIVAQIFAPECPYVGIMSIYPHQPRCATSTFSALFSFLLLTIYIMAQWMSNSLREQESISS